MDNSYLPIDDKKQIMDFLNKPTVFCSGMTCGDLRLPFEISSEEFLEYAKADFKENCNKAMINALSNTKRAIDNRVASLLYSFGLYEKSKRKNWDFPYCIDLLCKIGVVTPRNKKSRI